jgi:hypothetical protein
MLKDMRRSSLLDNSDGHHKGISKSSERGRFKAEAHDD